MKYIITARNSVPQTVFYCNDLNGGRMAPYSQSLAYQFDSKEVAQMVLNSLEWEYRGLKDFKIEILENFS